VFFESKMPLLFKRIYETLKKAQDLALKKVKDGTEAGEVDKAAREFIEKKGWGKYFGHGLGHGIGLSVHEPPFLRPQDSQILKQGMVLTLEPAIYLESKFGLRIEDMVLVTQGKGEILSGDIHR
jgi:Xaa-Pro aminopeptidase